MKRSLRFFSAGFLLCLLCFSISCKKEKVVPLAITISPEHPTAHNAVQFTSTQSGSGWAYYWYFGDGNYNTTNSSSTSHTYSGAGTFTVTLNIEYNGNPEGTVSTSVVVTQ